MTFMTDVQYMFKTMIPVCAILTYNSSRIGVTNGPWFFKFLFYNIVHPCGQIAMAGSIYVTIAISVERFLGNPFTV